MKPTASTPVLCVRARLDRTKRWLVCGVTGCGATLGIVVEDSPGYSGACLVFPPGWSVRYAPGPPGSRTLVWQLTALAIQRLRRGRAPRQRRSPAPAHKRGTELEGRIPLLPVDVTCRCGMRQVIDGEMLGLKNTTWEQWGRVSTPCGEPGCPRSAGRSGFCAEHGRGGRIDPYVASHTPHAGDGFTFHGERGLQLLVEYARRTGLDNE